MENIATDIFLYNRIAELKKNKEKNESYRIRWNFIKLLTHLYILYPFPVQNWIVEYHMFGANWLTHVTLSQIYWMGRVATELPVCHSKWKRHETSVHLNPNDQPLARVYSMFDLCSDTVLFFFTFLSCKFALSAL